MWCLLPVDFIPICCLLCDKSCDVVFRFLVPPTCVLLERLVVAFIVTEFGRTYTEDYCWSYSIAHSMLSWYIFWSRHRCFCRGVHSLRCGSKNGVWIIAVYSSQINLPLSSDVVKCRNLSWVFLLSEIRGPYPVSKDSSLLGGVNLTSAYGKSVHWFHSGWEFILAKLHHRTWVRHWWIVSGWTQVHFPTKAGPLPIIDVKIQTSKQQWEPIIGISIPNEHTEDPDHLVWSPSPLPKAQWG